MMKTGYWALDLRKDPTNIVREFIFIDRYGTPYNGTDVNFRIIRSGKRNLIDASLGSITSQNNPLVSQTVGNVITQKLQFDDNTNVINCSAGLLKEKWRGENMFYSKDSVISERLYAPIIPLTLFPTGDHVIKTYVKSDNPNINFVKNDENRKYFVSEHRGKEFVNGDNQGVYNTETNSWLKFDFGSIPQGSIVTQANLFLASHHSTFDGSGHTEGIVHNSSNPHKKNAWENSLSFRMGIGRMHFQWPANYDNSAWKIIIIMVEEIML